MNEGIGGEDSGGVIYNSVGTKNGSVSMAWMMVHEVHFYGEIYTLLQILYLGRTK